jgi:hypothetical protein
MPFSSVALRARLFGPLSPAFDSLRRFQRNQQGLVFPFTISPGF